MHEKKRKNRKKKTFKSTVWRKTAKNSFFSLIFSYAIQLNFSILSDFVRYRKFPIETILHGKFDRKIFRFFQGFSGGNSVIEKGEMDLLNIRHHENICRFWNWIEINCVQGSPACVFLKKNGTTRTVIENFHKRKIKFYDTILIIKSLLWLGNYCRQCNTILFVYWM